MSFQTSKTETGVNLKNNDRFDQVSIYAINIYYIHVVNLNVNTGKI